MDGTEFSAINNPFQQENGLPQQENKKNYQDKLEKTIFRFTCFQIAIVALQLVAVCVDATSRGYVFFGFLAFLLLAPPFIISVITEVIAIVIVKANYKVSEKETQKLSPTSTHYDSNASNQKKRLKPSKKALIVLFLMFGAVILICLGNLFLSRYFAISDAFSEEEQLWNDSLYSVKVIKTDPGSGVMTIQLDNDTIVDYVCKVNPGGIDSGYGPFCSYQFPDGSSSIGKYVLHKNYSDFQKLIIKYQGAFAVDDKYMTVVDQQKLESFFSELMQNADFNKAYKVFRNSEDTKLLHELDYIQIMDIEYEGKKWRSMGLFDWANRMGLEP